MSNASTPLVLTYAAPASGSRQGSRGDWLTFALFLPALVVPFVHFTFETSPLRAVQELWPTLPYHSSDDLLLFLLGTAFFMSFPLAGSMVRRLLQPLPPGKAERFGGWLIALACVALVAAMLAIVAKDAGSSLEWPPDRNDALVLSILAGGFGIVALGIWGAIRDRGESRLATENLLSSAYLANAWFCLVGFHENAELGYWLTLLPAGVLLVGLIRRSFRRRNAL